MKSFSPLRFPGGKAKVYDKVINFFVLNKFSSITYVEPFAGGSGLALLLLKNNKVDNLILNDVDKGIYSFWTSVLKYNAKFIDMIDKVNISIEEREKQIYIYAQKDKLDINNKENILSLGLATFYLNRVNRSGILKAGVIGGKNQNGNYKMDCRFNKENLIKKIKEIYSYKDRIEFHNKDVLDFIDYLSNKNKEKTFIFFDPPYYKKGSELYTNYFIHDDHVKLARKIESIESNWIVTYDNCDEIKKIYCNYDIKEFDINYTLENKIKTKEIVVFSKNLKSKF